MNTSMKKKIKSELYSKQKGKCVYCNCNMVLRTKGVSKQDLATLDHITPKSKGGKYSQNNITLVCLDCNSRKANGKMIKFLNLIIFYNIKKIRSKP